MDSLPKTIEEAIACGLIQKSKPAPPKKKNSEVVRYMIDLAKEGVSQTHIAKIVGRDQSSVCQSLRRYGRSVYLTFEEIEQLNKSRK